MKEIAQIRLLWVEDDADDYILNRSALAATQHLSFDLTWVANYEAALQAIADSDFDVCLVDYGLGAHTGLDLVRAGVELGVRAPMILLTGIEDEATAMRAVGAGAQDYLVKGQINSGMLVRAIRYAIERSKMQTELRNLALQDDLTGLYNRRGFFSLASQHLKLAQRQGHSCGVLYVDLDGLKWINDTFGHHMGSQAIIDAAEVLRTTMRAADIVARLGGDEFVVLITDAENASEAAITRRLEAMLRDFNQQTHYSFNLALSMGFAQIDLPNPKALEEAIVRADQAMYTHKRAKHAARVV